LVDVPIAAVTGRRYRRLSNKQRYQVDHHHGRHVDHRQIVGHAEQRRIDLIPDRAIGALAERLGIIRRRSTAISSRSRHSASLPTRARPLWTS
jgi:hypothetical protein